MRILFTVQGMGRGHLTQAIAAWEVLSGAGHEVIGVVAGNHPGRELAAFFTGAFPLPVTMLPSPGFLWKADRGVDLPRTLWNAVRHFGTWLTGLRRLREIVRDTRPDLIINFFEPLTGFAQAVRPLGVPVMSAAHQFALLGPEPGSKSGRPMAPLWLRAFIRFVGFRSWKYALSFAPSDATRPREDRLVVAPPLLRRHVLSLEPEHGDHVLIYMATPGYADLVRAWHREHPNVKLHCFYDRPGAPPVEAVGPNLTFHQLDGEKFLRLMAGCRAVMCTAGFESICEAAFLGKPVLMVPLDHHHEQELNARDAELSGVAIGHPVFDLDALSRLPRDADMAWFREWCLQADATLLETVERVARAALPGRGP